MPPEISEAPRPSDSTTRLPSKGAKESEQLAAKAPKQAMQTEMPPANSLAMWRRGLDWPTVIWIGMMHVLALAAPFYFSWQGLVAFLVLSVATGSLGVCMGYHRLLTHGSFQTYRPIRILLAFLGQLSGEGSALTWVANHRKHHVYSDKEGDPHSPRDGKIWCHMLWFMPNLGRKWHKELLDRYAPDMLKDRAMIWLHRIFLPTHFVLAGVLFAIGYFGTPLGMGGEHAVWYGASMVLWALALRMVYVMHITWLINSATHLWGYRNYETTDDSKNLWWVAILAFGEGWHNNHHAYQRVAAQGHRWWELDFTNWMILLMEKTGLAWNVVRLSDIPKGTKPA